MLSYFRLYRQEIRTTIRLSVPIILGQLGIMLMGVADTIQVGNMAEGAKFALDASGIANSVFITVAVLGINAISTVAPMISKAYERNQPSEIVRTFRASVQVALWASSFCVAIILLCVMNFEVFGQSPVVSSLAVNYLLIITMSIVPLYLFLALRQLSDGLSKTKAAMTITLSAVLFNVLLNHLLINGVWIFPEWGLNGAGVATLLSRIYMALGLWWVVYSDPQLDRYMKWKAPVLKVKELVLHIFKVGIPSGMQGFFEVAVFSAAAIMIGWIGEDPLAAHLVALSPASVSYMMISGLAAAGGIRVGAGLGQQNRTAIIKSGTTALLLGAAFMSLCGFFFLTAQHFIINLYIQDSAVTQIAVSLLTIAAFFQLSDGLQCVALGLLRGMADVNIPTLVTLFAYWGVGIPVGYLLAFRYHWGAEGIWMGLLAGLTVSALLLTIRFYTQVRRVRL